MPIKKHEGIKGTRKIYMIDPHSIQIKKGWNIRWDFTGQEDFERSIIEKGIRMPLTIKRTENNNFVLLDGERRLRAVLSAIEKGCEFKAVPCYIKPSTFSDAEALVEGLTCNDSKPFLPVEEAVGFKRLLDWEWKIEDIAKARGKSQGYIRNRLLLLDGSKEVQKAVNKKDITISLAENIIKKTEGNQKLQTELVKKAKKGKKERKAVRELVEESLSTPKEVCKECERRKKEVEKVVKIIENKILVVLEKFNSKFNHLSIKGVINSIHSILDILER